MFHAPVDISHVGECPTRRRIFHGDAPSRGQHRPSNPSLRGPSDLGNPNSLGNPNNLSLSNNPSNPGNLNAPSNRNGPNATNAPSNLSRRNNPSSPNSLSNRSDYSSEASSFIPSSIRDLSRNEKLSLIVLRWLPSG